MLTGRRIEMPDFVKSRWMVVIGLPLALVLLSGAMWLSPLRPRSAVPAAPPTTTPVGRAAVSVSARSADGIDAAPTASAPSTAAPRANAGRPTAEVQRGDITEVLHLFGRVVPEKQITVPAPVGGAVGALSAQPGQAVTRGQLLALLQPDPSADSQDPLIVGQIRAPASGTLIQVNAHAHDTVQAGQALFVLADQGSPMLRLDLVDDDVARLALGQRASARASDGASSEGVVVDVTPGQRGKPASALVHVDWSATPPQRDAIVDLDVAVQRKQNVLLLPSKAVHSVGGRHYVDYMDGSVRRRTIVDVGIASDGYTEITQGLADGQAVLIGP